MLICSPPSKKRSKKNPSCPVSFLCLMCKFCLLQSQIYLTNPTLDLQRYTSFFLLKILSILNTLLQLQAIKGYLDGQYFYSQMMHVSLDWYSLLFNFRAYSSFFKYGLQRKWGGVYTHPLFIFDMKLKPRPVIALHKRRRHR